MPEKSTKKKSTKKAAKKADTGRLTEIIMQCVRDEKTRNEALGLLGAL